MITNPQKKGGSGKTSVSHAIAVGLAKRGKSVLYLDSDSQGDAAQLALGRYCEQFHEGDFQALIDHFGMREETVYNALERSLRSDDNPNNHYQLKPPAVLDVDLSSLEEDPSSGNSFGKFYMMLSHDDIDDWDQKISQATALMTMNRTDLEFNIPGAFYSLIQKAAHIYNAEYVVVDMSPSSNAMNTINFLTSDLFVLPASPTLKVRDAILSFARKLPSWVDMYNNKVRRLQLDAGPGRCKYPLPECKPKLLGLLFGEVGRQGGCIRPYNQYQVLIKIKSAFEQALLPALQGYNFLLPNDRYVQMLEQLAREPGHVPPPIPRRVAPQQGAAGQQNAGPPQNENRILLSIPALTVGQVGYLPDYASLQQMSERASFPVSCMRWTHLYTVVNPAARRRRTREEVDEEEHGEDFVLRRITDNRLIASHKRIIQQAANVYKPLLDACIQVQDAKRQEEPLHMSPPVL